MFDDFFMKYDDVMGQMGGDITLFSVLSIVIISILMIYLLFKIVFYVFQGIGLMAYAKKNNIPNAWLAWIPVGNMYLLGKLGFEVYAEKKDSNFTWILLGVSAGNVLLANTPLLYLCIMATLVFSIWAYYNIFKKAFPDKATIYLILSIILRAGGIILFATRNKAPKGDDSISTQSNASQGTHQKRFCTSCGKEIKEDSNFCVYCGHKN